MVGEIDGGRGTGEGRREKGDGGREDGGRWTGRREKGVGDGDGEGKGNQKRSINSFLYEKNT